MAEYSEIIISHPGTDFDSIASMWAAHRLYPDRPVVMIAGTDSNVHEFMALYGQEFPTVKLKEIDIAAVRHITVVDCSSRSQLSRIEGLLDRENVRVEVWDHHREDGPDFRVDEFKYGKSGANTTLIVREMINRGITVSREEATLLLLGIYEDTGSLRFPTTTPDDLEVATWLLRAGASLDIVDRFLSITITPAQKALLNNLSLNVSVVEVRGISIHMTQAVVEEFVDEIAYLAKKVQENENADVIFAIVQMHERVFIVGRSRMPAVDVGQILSIFGGGGHAQAASCLLTGSNLSKASQRLLDAIREQVKPTLVAREIMSTQVRSITPDSTIEEAHTIIAHTGYSGLVVSDDSRSVIGIITRSNVDKAIQHDLGHAPVKGYMIREPIVLSEDASLAEITKTIIDERVGFLPVVFASKVSGVITRSDVLRAMHASGRPVEGRSLSAIERRPDEYGKELLAKLPVEKLDQLAVAGELADDTGVQCYLVGGIVRDLVLGQPNVDIDLLIEGDGIEFAHVMGDKLGGKVIENPRFRTAKIVFGEDNTHIDVATARDEFYVRPGALPQVEAAGIRDDLVRRDFTINTVAIQINTRKWGYFVDHFGGLDDIENKLIRVLHTFSFVDDPTRILRALRFSERLGFELESQTRELLNRALLEGRLDDVSPERIREEILLCLREEDPWKICGRIHEEGVFGVMYQIVCPPVDLSKSENLVSEAMDWISQYLDPDEITPGEYAYMAFILFATRTEDACGFMRKYKFNHEYYALAESVEKIEKVVAVLANPDAPPSEVVAGLEKLPEPFWIALAAGNSDNSPQRKHIKDFLTKYRHVSTEISGDDLITEGFTPGPAFSSAIDAVKRARLDGKIKSREEELELARKVISEIEIEGAV